MLGAEGHARQDVINQTFHLFFPLDLPKTADSSQISRSGIPPPQRCCSALGTGDPTASLGARWPERARRTLHGGARAAARCPAPRRLVFITPDTPTSIVQGNPFGTGLKVAVVPLPNRPRGLGAGVVRFTMYHPDVPRGPRRHWVPKRSDTLLFQLLQRGRSRGFRRCQPRGLKVASVASRSTSSCLAFLGRSCCSWPISAPCSSGSREGS